MSASSGSTSSAPALKERNSWPGLLPEAALATATCRKGSREPSFASSLSAAGGLSSMSMGNTGTGDITAAAKGSVSAILATAVALGTSSTLARSLRTDWLSSSCRSKLCLVRFAVPCSGLPLSEALSERTDPADDRLEEHAAICRSISNSSSSAWSLSRRFRAISRERINSARAVAPVEETDTAAWDLSSRVLVRSVLWTTTCGADTAHATGTRPAVATAPPSTLLVLAGGSGVVPTEPDETAIPSGESTI